MKKIILFVIFGFILLCGVKTYSADIIPSSPIKNNVQTVGLYQVGKDVRIYKFPDENSHILYRVQWSTNEFFPEEIGAENFFSVYVTDKELALVNTVDIADGWVEIVYNNKTGETGWIKEDDPYKFMTWINFYNTYGKKYGLNLLKGAPSFCREIKASTDDKAKTISEINAPRKIHLNIIRGNWALVSVLDVDKTPKTGYIRWRGDDGIKYYFPAVK